MLQKHHARDILPTTSRARSYEERDHALALYAPVSLLILPVVWLALVMVGFTGMYWATGTPSLSSAITLSGSSLLTLGFAPVYTLATTFLAVTEAVIGLVLIALLIAYLPTMYTAFSRRETAVAMLEVRAGSPPSAIELIARFNRLHRLDRLRDLWMAWEVWFAELEETHTSLAALVFFRSPQHDRSWVTAAGSVLDGAAMVLAAVDIPATTEAALCIRAGYLALRRIADFFRIPYNPTPQSTDTISIAREEFNEACDRLQNQNVPLKPDRDQAWRDFVGWRVNYDSALLGLAALTLAPYAPWSSDRSLRRQPRARKTP